MPMLVSQRRKSNGNCQEKCVGKDNFTEDDTKLAPLLE
jgi:hypothetical protein